MVRFTLNPNELPALSADQKARLDTMDDAALSVAAASDADNPPLTEDELDRLSGARHVRQVRAQTGLSQTLFAKTFHINVARLRDLEQGRTQPDSAVLAYLAVIDKEPDAVRRALASVD